MIAPIRAALRALLLGSGVIIVFALSAFRQLLPAPESTLKAEVRPQAVAEAMSAATARSDAAKIPDRDTASAARRDDRPAPIVRQVPAQGVVAVSQAVPVQSSSAPTDAPSSRVSAANAQAGPPVAASRTSALDVGQRDASHVELLPRIEELEDAIQAPPGPASSPACVAVPLVRKPAAVFRAVPLETPEEAGDTAELEARLVGLERQLTRLAQAQEEKQPTQADMTAALLRQLQQALQAQAAPPPALDLLRAANPVNSAAGQPEPATPAPTDATTTTSQSPGEAILRAEPNANNPELFSMHFQDADISEVLNMLGQLAGVNILVGKDVVGKVPAANLQDVTIEQALQSILRSLGYTFERDGEFVFVMSQAEADMRGRLKRKLITKIYRPNYISALDLQKLIVPLQTKDIGQIAVTEPAEVGISTDAESAGGDRLAQRDAVLVQDYPEVIEQIDRVFEELDVPPMQVVIEAMILSVTLTDNMAFGVNFALLNGQNDGLGVVGNGSELNGSVGFPGVGAGSVLPPGAEFLANTAGLKYGFLRGDVSMFINALETITDTNLIASPNIRVLNKQKANLIIGQQLAYTTTTQNGTSSIESVNFLEVGTRLIIRPFIAPDGLVRLELHPEQSSGTIDNRNLPNKSTTEVTTNVMVRDGTTVVVGGLIEEQIVESQDRVPFFGAIPVVGNLFRSKSDQLQRRELIVLITPRIVREPDAEIEGDIASYEFQNRADEFRRRITPINQRNLARMDYERAQYFFDHGDYPRARRHIELSLNENKNDLDALRLKHQIDEAVRTQTRSWVKWPPFGKKHTDPPPAEIHYEGLPPEMIEYTAP